MVVPYATIPGTRRLFSVPAVVAVTGVQVLAVLPALVASSLITMECGVIPVMDLLARSFFTESETSPFGETKHEQHDEICSFGRNAYTFAQMFPFWLGADVVEDAPLFVMFTIESPMFRFTA